MTGLPRDGDTDGVGRRREDDGPPTGPVGRLGLDRNQVITPVVGTSMVLGTRGPRGRTRRVSSMVVCALGGLTKVSRSLSGTVGTRWESRRPSTGPVGVKTALGPARSPLVTATASALGLAPVSVGLEAGRHLTVTGVTLEPVPPLGPGPLRTPGGTGATRKVVGGPLTLVRDRVGTVRIERPAGVLAPTVERTWVG